MKKKSKKFIPTWQYRDKFDPLSEEEWDILLSLVSKNQSEKNKIYEYFTSRTNGIAGSYFIVKSGDVYYQWSSVDDGNERIAKFDFENLKLYFELTWHLKYWFLVDRHYGGTNPPLKVSQSYIFDLIKKLTCPLGIHSNLLLKWCMFYNITEAIEYLIKDDSVISDLDPLNINNYNYYNIDRFEKVFLQNPNISNYLVSKKDPVTIRIVKRIMEKPLPKDLEREDIERFNNIVKTLGIIPDITKEQFVEYVKTGNSTMVKLAIDNKIIKLTQSDSYLLFLAVQNGYTEIVDLLVKNPKIDVNYKNCKSLIYAAYYEYTEIVKALLSRPDIEFDPKKVLKYADVESKKIIEDYLKKSGKGTTIS